MASTYGTSAMTLICDVLVERGLCDYRQAFDLAQEFERELSRCAWIDTREGAVFTRQTAGDHDGRANRPLGF